MQTISFYNLAYMLLPLAIVVYFYFKYTQDKKEIVYATVRMVLQLLLIGYLLIFIFNTKNIFLGLFILTFMLVIATMIVLRVTTNKSLKNYSLIFFASFISSFIHLFLILEVVLDLESFYEPRYAIPLAGMVFANIMNIISLSIERFEKEISRNESFEEARKISFKACMIPQINTLLAVGLVALPGMMTGQILSGVDPLIAVRYQILIMIMSISSGGLAVIIYYNFLEKFKLYSKK
ncbi:hypothetical protein CP985_03990 [Malaciobacter mytili LMG 24559]|uniref:Uncharacterized protein n=1 Tax=Malaciobacter mytili LMG 24559 TaxID=1032238 RepID=A0AAX2AI83_9BACT|nr:ABC transporter permease [Malaciobacter mytili]AXH13715.1 UPF0014 domain-containing membrane protein, putative permease [Malaciobacter mytili LMG 24559]RXK16325.1 hypothetical protein CP985_03990 [Malaciobacter mytili LMG 24559]